MKGTQKWKLLYILVMVGILVLAELASRAVTVMAELEPIDRKHCIVIDAGHGGEDGGAISCTGRPESGYNLDFALRLDDLMHLLGYDTRMIRTTDTAVYTKGETIAQKKASDLKERVRLVNETEGALLLSIHQNQFPDGRYSGAQVFFAPTQGSEALAKVLQANFTSSVNPGSRRECKKAGGIYLMEHITCTGILIECGFLSNPEEEYRLGTPEYQKKLCSVIAATVSHYLSNT